jgi:hypothetical protein
VVSVHQFLLVDAGLHSFVEFGHELLQLLPALLDLFLHLFLLNDGLVSVGSEFAKQIVVGRPVVDLGGASLLE